MTKISLTISILIGLSKVSFCQIDIDSLKTTETISVLIENQKANIINDSLTLMAGHLFSTSIEHKYIRISNSSGTYIQVFSELDNYRNPIFTDRLGWMNFVSDSIFDINGDNIADLAIHWYPASGCCLAEMYDCYIYNLEADEFSNKINIPNPTFLPEQSLTWSMTYGHPGETEYYELKWSAYKTDILKSYEWKGRAHDLILLTDFETGEKSTIKSPPKYLEKLNGFEWFMMKPKSEEENRN